LVCFATAGYLLYLYKWQGKNYLWNLVPLFILWSNLHAGYTLGLILIGTMLIGEVSNHFLGFRGLEILTWKQIRTLLFWSLLSGIAVLANPNGINTWLVPFQTIGVQALQQQVSEWASPDFHQISQQTFLALFFITLIAIFYSKKRLDGSDAASLLVFATLALVARRNFGPFALVAAPVLARHLWPALQGGWEGTPGLLERIESWAMKTAFRKKELTPPRTNSALNLAILVLLGLAAIGKCYLVNTPQSSAEYEARLFPKGAVSYLEIHHPPGRLFNSYDWGGYLLWNARNYPVFVDGRTDLYNDEIIGQWLGVVNAKANWQATLNRWEVHLVLLEPDWPVVPLLADQGWKLLYSDSISVLYGR
ncbi:MAG TPA: hypothetical protein VMT46_07855, partial [Anaerolineaceae bacterium]|nr:hypothetical protein [Anaerolineaceae bacterium]